MTSVQYRKLTFICLLAVLLAGCAYAPSRRLVRDPLTPPVQVAGWKIIPDICDYENVDGVDTSRWDFGVGLRTEIPRPKLIDSTAPMTVLQVDLLEVLLEDGTQLELVQTFAGYVSNRSHPEIVRVYDFADRRIDFPPGTQKATVEFVVRIQKAYHRYEDVDKGIWGDDFIVDSTLPEEKVQVTIPLVLREKPGANGPED